MDSIDNAISQAIIKYIEDNHGNLDPIAKRQIESWHFEWASAGTPTCSSALDDEAPAKDNNDYSGRLLWKIDAPESPVVITLTSQCSWTETNLDWTCRVSAHFDKPPTESKPKKIFKKLCNRLEKDDYISKMFIQNENSSEADADDDISPDGIILAQASVKTPESGLEERVYTDPDVAEGIRRSIWNTAQNPIDVLELVIQYLPLLPCVGLRSTELQSTTKLADRAALRLLEDAMCDACDREGEEEIVQDLHIQKKSRKDS